MIWRYFLAGLLFVGGGLLLWSQWLAAAAVAARAQPSAPVAIGEIAALELNPLAGRLVFEELALGHSALALDLSAKGAFRAAIAHARHARKIFEIAISRAPIAPGTWIGFARADLQINGVTQDTAAALARSYATGPRQGWVAPRRVRLALLTWDVLEPNLQNVVTEEIVGMSSTETGANDLAKIYLGLRPALLRGPMERAMTTAPLASQKRFLNSVAKLIGR